MSDSNLNELIRREQYHRQLAHAHENKAEYYWNKANELMLEIIAENKKRARPQEQF